jgi:ATP/maltotriose-dependent transcriptional regulator MalT
LAQAAGIHGGGLAASVLSARALFWQGNAAACEETLSRYNPDAMTEDELLAWGDVRIPNLQWSIGETDGAHEILRLMRDRVTHRAGRLFIDGLAAMMAMGEGHLDEALALSERILADPPACAQTLDRAVIASTIPLALMGRFDQVAEVAVHAHQIDHVDDLRGHFRAVGEIWGLVFAGCFDAAEERSSHIARTSSPGQSLAWAMDNVLASTVQVARGRFRAAVSRMEQTVAVLVSTSTAEWNVFARLLLAQSYCALGEVEAGAKTLAELRTCLGPGLAGLEPQLRLTEAWLAAAQGHVSAAVTLTVDAGDMARRSGQRAIELRALHDAIRFGDRTSLPRAIDVASGVDGRLAPVYAAHAAALAKRNPAAVYDAAEQFEKIGALLSAADAAAQAAVLFDAAGDRRRRAKAAAAAERLAAACGGIKTPALMLVGHPLPLSTREREIANLVAQGLSNREIAERLVVSTRTVEGHIYRACAKGGLRDREELAALVRDSKPY